MGVRKQMIVKKAISNPVLKVVFDLTSKGIEATHIFASNNELRDEGIRRLTRAMPILELLEADLKTSI